jgi:hypothetical protein
MGRKGRVGVPAYGRIGVRERWSRDALGTFLTDGTYETNRTNAIWVGFAFPVRCILSPSPRPDEDEDEGLCSPTPIRPYADTPTRFFLSSLTISRPSRPG